MQGILLESHLAYLSGRTYVLSLYPLPDLCLNSSAPLSWFHLLAATCFKIIPGTSPTATLPTTKTI